MAEIIRDFQSELERIQSRYAKRPLGELLHLLLIAQEREELVTVGYDEETIRSRVVALEASESIKELIQRALTWVWKDEEMHVIYVRGSLFKLGSPLVRLRALIRQFVGHLSGWAASVIQHAPWTRAPIARLAAHTIAFAGFLMGRLPKAIRRHLVHKPFRQYCLFQVDAEITAEICWRRIASLTEILKLPGQLIKNFSQIAEDEARHRFIFQTIADSLTDNDAAATGVSEAQLAENFRDAGDFFLPRSLRTPDKGLGENPVGSGAPVWCYQGRSLGEKIPLFQKILTDCDLANAIRERADQLHKKPGDLTIAIKPTFMMGYHKADLSPITDPIVLEELARFLQGEGIRKIAVVDGRNIYEKFFENRTVKGVARYFGIESSLYEVVDATTDQVPFEYGRGMAHSTICRTWQEADFRISFGKLRSHPVEFALLTLANLEGLSRPWTEFIFLEREADFAHAHNMLLDQFPPDYSLLDAYEKTPDGLVGVMGRPKAKSALRFYTGRDGLAVDITVGRHLGIRFEEVYRLLRHVGHWFGAWPEKIEVRGEDRPIARWHGPYSSEFCSFLGFVSLWVYEFFGRGALFVPQMDPQAFPLRTPEGFFVRFGRRIVQMVLGFRLART